jgi:hypothetical protein
MILAPLALMGTGGDRRAPAPQHFVRVLSRAIPNTARKRTQPSAGRSPLDRVRFDRLARTLSSRRTALAGLAAALTQLLCSSSDTAARRPH